MTASPKEVIDALLSQTIVLNESAQVIASSNDNLPYVIYTLAGAAVVTLIGTYLNNHSHLKRFKIGLANAAERQTKQLKQDIRRQEEQQKHRY